MDIRQVNSIANKYLLKFEKRDYRDVMGKSFGVAVQNDFANAGFEYDMNKLYHAVYPYEYPVNYPEHIEAIKDMQTVMNTIYTVFRYAQKDGPFYDTPETRGWLIRALEHLAGLAEEELFK